MPKNFYKNNKKAYFSIINTKNKTNNSYKTYKKVPMLIDFQNSNSSTTENMKKT